MQVDSPSTFSHSTSNPAPVRNYNASSAAALKARGGDKSLEKFIHRRQAIKMPTRFAKSTSSSLGLTLHGSQDPVDQTTSNVTSHQETSIGSSDALDHAGLSPRRLASYAERIGASLPLSSGSPKSKKTGSETREEILNSLLLNSQPATPTSVSTLNGGETQLQKASLQSDSTLQLFHYKLEETVSSFRESIHGDMQNLHLEILRQFHMQEMGMSSVLRLLLENQAEMMKEIQTLREEIQHLHHLL